MPEPLRPPDSRGAGPWPRALIGHTGFVGGNLARSRPFDECYNSRNIEAIAGRSFDLVVCSGAPAEKWRANRDPDADRRNLDRLWDALCRASAAKVVLISTIDVYAAPDGVDEDDAPDAHAATAYGRHRSELERRVADRFDSLIVRLPGLFGPGLKKNAIYDLLHDNEIHKIDHRSIYQFYDVARLRHDIEVALAHGLRLLNVATGPTSMAEVARAGFGIELTAEPAPAPARYDMRTKHGRLFGGSGGYLMSHDEVLAAVRSFVAAEREAIRRCA